MAASPEIDHEIERDSAEFIQQRWKIIANIVLGSLRRTLVWLRSVDAHRGFVLAKLSGNVCGMQLANSLAPAALFCALGVTSGCFSDPAARGSVAQGDTPASSAPRGCDVGDAMPAAAPNGYYTNGATVCTADGRAHLFHGVDRPSLEWSPAGEQIIPQDFQAMADWNANVVRIALNQDFWLSGAALFDPTYASTVEHAVAWAEAAGLDVILDLHWSDRGDLTVGAAGTGTKQDTPGGSNQQQMADANSIQFWTEVATAFKGDGRVLFELYNEPNGIGWGAWLSGGMAAGFQVAGMQQLYDAVRSTGAENLVIAGGLDWAFDLSGVRQSRIVGHNILYATHPYDKGDNQPSVWESSFGYLATNNLAPVIVTEFGDGRTACTGAWDSQLIQFADAHAISWTAWAWYPAAQSCSFPALISDWTASTTVQGDVVKAALASYPKMAPVMLDASSNSTAEAASDSEAPVDPPGDAAAPGDPGDAGASDSASTDASVTDAAAPRDAADGAADATGSL